MRKPKRKEAPDWFGCGRVITQESWDAFNAARRAYYEKKDAEKLIKTWTADTGSSLPLSDWLIKDLKPL